VSELARIVARSMKGTPSQHDMANFRVLILFGAIKFTYKLIHKRIKKRKK
jgi:pilus assembly protein TadC